MTPLPIVLSWLADVRPTYDYPPGLFVRGSTVGLKALVAADDALISWQALRATCRETSHERGTRTLELARDIALDNLIQFEEWSLLARLGL